MDTCVWCRTLDKLDHKDIINEFNAIVRIIQKAMNGRIEIISSSAVFVETSLIEPIKKEKIETLINRIATHELKLSIHTRKLAEKIAEDCGTGNMDSVHLALAIENIKNPIEYEAGL